jgi:hypothetical protein
MKKLALTALLLALPILSSASAQTVAELLTVTSISSTLDSATTLKLPMPGGLVKNPAYAAQLAPALLQGDIKKFTEFNLILTTGMAIKLTDAYLNNLKTQFAVDGFFQEGSDRAYKMGPDLWTRADFKGDSGRTRVVFVSKSPTQVKLFTAVSK